MRTSVCQGHEKLHFKQLKTKSKHLKLGHMQRSASRSLYRARIQKHRCEYKNIDATTENYAPASSWRRSTLKDSNEFNKKINTFRKPNSMVRRWNEFAGQQKQSVELLSEDPTQTQSPGDVTTSPLCGRMQEAVTSKCSGTRYADGGKLQEPRHRRQIDNRQIPQG